MGDGGLVITVPKACWHHYGLKAGDEVIVIADGELRIRPNGKYRNGKAQRKTKAG